jgi:hypothetical protein
LLLPQAWRELSSQLAPSAAGKLRVAGDISFALKFNRKKRKERKELGRFCSSTTASYLFSYCGQLWLTFSNQTEPHVRHICTHKKDAIVVNSLFTA